MLESKRCWRGMLWEGDGGEAGGKTEGREGCWRERKRDWEKEGKRMREIKRKMMKSM